MRTVIVTIMFLSLTINIAQSQNTYSSSADGIRSAPRLLNYQGYFADSAGVPVTNPAQSMTFRIYGTASGGTPLWDETQTSVEVEKGIFRVLLGYVTEIPDSIFAGGNDRWLEVLTGGQTLAPRTRIVSVPYAYHAARADTADYLKYIIDDYDWSRGTSDSVLFTCHQLGIARGSASDSLIGTQRYTHINLGMSSKTGITGNNNTMCTVTGGNANYARGNYSTVTGGQLNRTFGECGIIVGGYGDSVYAVNGGLLSGIGNIAGDGSADTACAVVGGRYNRALGKYTLIVAGRLNNVTDYSVVYCGLSDTVKAAWGGVFVGSGNLAGNAANDTGTVINSGNSHLGGDSYSTIIGGNNTWTTGDYSTAVGGLNQESWGTYSGIMSGSGNRAGNGYYDSATVACGGYENTAIEPFSAVVGGYINSANDSLSFIGGGRNNTANSWYASVSGGQANRASEMYSSIIGGHADTSIGYNAASLSGYNNQAGSSVLDTSAVTGGGCNNIAAGAGNTIVGGRDNEAGNSDYAMLFGGYLNNAWGDHAAIVGGYNNTANPAAVIGAGSGNYATGSYSVIYSGMDIRLNGNYSVCLGGSTDSSNAPMCGIISGFHNVACLQTSDSFAVLGGGMDNLTRGRASTVGGGRINQARSSYSCVGGGRENTAFGEHSTVFGGDSNFAWSDYGGSLSGFNNVTGALYEIGTLICGGLNNRTSLNYTTVGGGLCDTAVNIFSTVTGGASNYAHTQGSTVLGGYDCDAWGDDATVAGGGQSYAASSYATVTGGSQNHAYGMAGVVSGGYQNFAGRFGGSGPYSAIPGGYADTAGGDYSFAVGNHSVVLPYTIYNHSAAFNGQVATASSELRCGIMAKTGGSFTIDHPLDPEHKILNHYFVESPDMANVYRGIAVTGSDGRAAVHLPEYFDLLNKDPLVQLTAEGSSEWVYLEKNVHDNLFIIAGAPGTRVHWLVTGARSDQSANIIRAVMPVEQNKDGPLLGRMLDDDFLVSTLDQLQEKGNNEQFEFRSGSWKIRARGKNPVNKEGR